MAEGNYPEEMSYHAEHGWAELDGAVATLGITWFAQDALGEVVFFDPPDVGDAIVAGRPYGEVESLKAVSDLIAPLSGTVIEVNSALDADVELINAEPYAAGWLIKVEVSQPEEFESLLGADAYAATLS